ncbi:amino acid ABC transporter permease [Nordella sp. HKS 07]|uniref:amino acid ABC transporter permease n=1 Tax=Nordella sp. HKS 07 TaxID=2712222 RepID=UPI0013E19612|nr:amino acid ABC transporter permease [Nordella sp. HKS 07]QIG47800.1 amino acid ABC transporter permease [Nordella sp. HKS 07]
MAHFLHEVWIARFALLQGLALTLWLSVISICVGTVLGVLGGIALTYGGRFTRWPVRAVVDALRGIPVLVLILAVFYLLTFAGINFTAVQSGLIALSLFSGAHMAEIVRGALSAIPQGQIDAGKALGLSPFRIFLLVLLPQAVRMIIPVWINTGAELVKTSTLLSVIGTGELLFRTQEIIGRNFMTLEFYGLAGALFFLINFIIEKAGQAVGRRFALR